MYWNDTKTIVFAFILKISGPSSQAWVQKTWAQKRGLTGLGLRRPRVRKPEFGSRREANIFGKWKNRIKNIEFSLFFLRTQPCTEPPAVVFCWKPNKTHGFWAPCVLERHKNHCFCIHFRNFRTIPPSLGSKSLGSKTGAHRDGAQKAKAQKTKSWLQKMCEYFLGTKKMYRKHGVFAFFLLRNRQGWVNPSVPYKT